MIPLADDAFAAAPAAERAVIGRVAARTRGRGDDLHGRRVRRPRGSRRRLVAPRQRGQALDHAGAPLRGGMLTFDKLRGGGDAAARLLRRVRVFSCAESLGGVESLIEHPALMTHASVPPDVRSGLGISDGLVRASAGIEHPDDLIEDLRQALG